MTMIADFEVNHPLTKKFPALLAFMRAEPIWNWDSDKYPGLSGFNFRLFTGLRLSANKPSYYSTIESIRRQAMPDRKSDKRSSTCLMIVTMKLSKPKPKRKPLVLIHHMWCPTMC